MIIRFWRKQSAKGRIFSLVGLMLFLSVVTSFSFYKNHPFITATWIWDAKLIAQQKDDMISFAKTNGINLIYLHIEQDAISPQQYRFFIRTATRERIKVDALGGDPNWALAANQASIGNFIAWVKNYNKIIDDANRQQKASIIVGVNILESNEGDYVSFHKQGTEQMKKELAILQEELAKYPAFAGSAVHDYKSWRLSSKQE